jgi:hypothetical protein
MGKSQIFVIGDQQQPTMPDGLKMQGPEQFRLIPEMDATDAAMINEAIKNPTSRIVRFIYRKCR